MAKTEQTESPEYIQAKIKELRAYAKEYHNFSATMPSDPFAYRWKLIAAAMTFQADSLESLFEH